MLRFSFKQIKRIAEKKVFSSNASNTPNDKGAGKNARLALAAAALDLEASFANLSSGDNFKYLSTKKSISK